MRDSVLLGLFADLMSAVEGIADTMATNEGERRLQEAIGRMSTQVGAVHDELVMLREKLAAHVDVDLSEEIAAVDALTARLDADVPDAVPPPVEPAPGA